MDIIIIAAQLILSLSILVVLHELGHFLPAKLFKMRVEKFYLFFDPWFSLFKIKKGDTEYGIGWVPLGGFVKISGMIDESMDKEQMAKPPEPWEFRSKPAWQRMIVMIGGVTVNVILGAAIYAMVVFVYGEQYLPTANAKYGVVVDSTGYEMGLRNGDKILSLNNEEVENFNQIPMKLILDEITTVQVDREGEKLNLEVPAGLIDKMVDSRNMVSPRIPFIAAKFTKESVASEAGLKKRDKIIGINGEELLYFDVFKTELQNYIGETVIVNVERNGEAKELSLTVPETG